MLPYLFHLRFFPLKTTPKICKQLGGGGGGGGGGRNNLKAEFHKMDRGIWVIRRDKTPSLVQDNFLSWYGPKKNIVTPN